MIDQNGTAHAYALDKLGRQRADAATLAAETEIDDAVLRFERTFSDRGLLTAITSYDAAEGGDVVNQIVRAYNAFRQPTAEYQAHAGEVNTETTPKVGYDYADGSQGTIRPTKLTYPDGRELEYGYGAADSYDDRLGRVAKLGAPPQLTAGLVAYWKLDEASGARRDSLGRVDLTIPSSGTVTQQTGKIAHAAGFAKSPGGRLQSTSAALDFNKQDFTTCGWVRFDSTSGIQGMWGKGAAGSGSYLGQEWIVYLEGGGSPRVAVVASDGTHSGAFMFNAINPSTGVWYFVCFWYDATEEKLYLQLNDETPVAETYTYGPSARGNEFCVGHSLDNDLDGRVDEVGVWNRVLSSEERAALYNGGAGRTYPFGELYAEYEYSGLRNAAKTTYPEPQVACDLTFGAETGDPFAGTLDALDRLIQCPWLRDGAPIAGASYQHDRLGNRTQMQRLGYAADDDLERYEYDGLERLINLARGDVDEPKGAERWNLDATGNWREYGVMSADDPAKNLLQRRAANAANELTSIERFYGAAWSQPQYDRAGNMTAFPQSLAPSAGYTAVYDAWNRLVKLKDGATEVEAYGYDGLFRRITATADSVVRHSFYSKSWRLLEERLDDSEAAERQFVWGVRYIDDLILRDRDPDGESGLIERLYNLQDGNWNTVAVVDPAGEVVERCRYTAYGMPTRLQANGSAAEGPDEIQWETLCCGYRYDHATGNYGVRFRVLQPRLGFWLTRDPYIRGSISRPYMYCVANPIGYYDHSGLVEEPTNKSDCVEIRTGEVVTISWIEALEGSNTLVNAIANPPPPDFLNERAAKRYRPNRARKKATILKTLGQIKQSKEFRNIHLLDGVIQCCKGVVQRVVDRGIEQIGGYTPQPGSREAGLPVFLEGKSGAPEATETLSNNGTCVTITSRQRFRVNWFENLGQATINWNGGLLPYAWSELEVKVCCNGAVEVAASGSVIPSYTVYYEGAAVDTYSMGDGNIEDNLEAFEAPGVDEDAPERAWTN